MRRMVGWPYEDTSGGNTPSKARLGDLSKLPPPFVAGTAGFTETTVPAEAAASSSHAAAIQDVSSRLDVTATPAAASSAEPAAPLVSAPRHADVSDKEVLTAPSSSDYAGLKASRPRDYAALQAPLSRDFMSLKPSSSGYVVRDESSQEVDRTVPPASGFAPYRDELGRAASFAAASGEYTSFQAASAPERDSGFSWRVVESEQRASRLSLPNVSLLAFAASTRARLSGFGPRFELMAAGCIAALAGYGVTAWTCDLSQTKARAARNSESVLTGAAIAPALEVARAATWALANPEGSVSTVVVSAAASQPSLRGVIPAHAGQAQRARRGVAPSATGAKLVAARTQPLAATLASRTAQASRVAAGRRTEEASTELERRQPDLMALAVAVADKRAPAGSSVKGARRAADVAAPMRPEDWKELAMLVAPAESARAQAPAHALHAAVAPQHAADAPQHAADAPDEELAAVDAAAIPRVPAGVFSSTEQPSTGAAHVLPTHAVLQNIVVRGPLPKSIIRRSLGRLERELAQCAPICARTADACASGHWHAETVLDEAGRSRAPHVSGPVAGSQLSECISKATSRLTILAPDTGTVHVSWDVKFTY